MAIELPADAHDHPTRQARWSDVSAYTGFRDPDLGEGEVALGAHPPGPRCPCGTTEVDEGEHVDCAYCETFRCPRCERWCSWEMGHCECPLCDDCCSVFGFPCAEAA